MDGGAAGLNEGGRRQRAEPGIRAAFGWSEFTLRTTLRPEWGTVKFAAGLKSATKTMKSRENAESHSVWLGADSAVVAGRSLCADCSD